MKTERYTELMEYYNNHKNRDILIIGELLDEIDNLMKALSDSRQSEANALNLITELKFPNNRMGM